MRIPAALTGFSSIQAARTLVLHGGGERELEEDTPKVVFRVADVKVARSVLMDKGVPLGEVRSPAPGVWVFDGADPEALYSTSRR